MQLNSLHIQDLAIIDELRVEFGSGLNVMTGETGAGKTIIIEALKLVLGSRAQPDLVRSGKEKASVTAVFDADDVPEYIRSALDGCGIVVDGELIVTRVVASQGRGRASINGTPVTQSMLKNVAEGLVDVSSQHEHQLLLEPSRHASIVDGFGDLSDPFEAYLGAHRKFVALSSEIRELEENERQAKEKLDYLKFQFDEIKALDPRPGEDEEINAELKRTKHAVTLKDNARVSAAALNGDAGSAMEMLDHAMNAVGQCEQYEARAAGWRDALERARVEMEEVARDLGSYAEGLQSDPARLEELDDRMHSLRALMRKHGGSLEECLKQKEKIAAEIELAQNYDDIIAAKRTECLELADERLGTANLLSKSRKKAAKELGAAVEGELAGLGMGKVKFSVGVKRLDESEWDEGGPDRVEFLFSPNVGEPMMQLTRIASGGELSRVMLALKGAISGRASFVPTSVFDEVDSGIGGAIAEVVGKKLKNVSRARQVICITHLPQVAAYGDKHLTITKRVESGRTVATIKNIFDAARVDEIARMLGGTKITDTTLNHAREMLEHAVGE
jgi:DNA repair protein RecN (Recombination protein N)